MRERRCIVTADQLQIFAGGAYAHYPVVDATGLEGAWDFTLSFSPIPPGQLAGPRNVGHGRSHRFGKGRRQESFFESGEGQCACRG